MADKRIKMFEPCSPGCRFASDGIAEFFPSREYPTIRRAKDGTFRGGGGSTLWYLFVCNDPNCIGEVMVRWDAIMDFIAAGLGMRTRL